MQLTRILAGGALAAALCAALGEAPYTLAELIRDFRAFQLEVYEHQLGLQAERVAQLQQELQRVRADEQRLEAGERSAELEVTHMDEQLTNPKLSPEERSELVAMREEFLSSGLHKIRAGRAQLAAEDAALVARIRNEQARLHLLRERAARTRNQQESQ
jgi:hypothetical protein